MCKTLQKSSVFLLIVYTKRVKTLLFFKNYLQLRLIYVFRLNDMNDINLDNLIKTTLLKES